MFGDGRFENAEAESGGRARRLLDRRAALVGAAVIAFLLADLASGAPRLSRQQVLPVPAGVCGDIGDPSTPAIGADGRGNLAVSLLLRGTMAASLARSSDGGRTFTASVIEGASACSGGPASHEYLVNPRAALGPDGTAWYGSSWIGNDRGLFAYGVEAFASDGGVARPTGAAQDIAVLPDLHGGGARLLWDAFDQVPNPVFGGYAPTAVRLRTAVTTRRGELSGEQTVLEPPKDKLLDDPSLVRAGNALVAVASMAGYSDLVATLNPATAADPVRFAGVSARSTDGGASWTPGSQAGSPVLFTASRDGHDLTVVISDVAAGPGGRVVRAYAEAPKGGRGSIVVTVSDDAGATWSPPRTVVSAPVVAFQPAVAVLPRGRIALSWYDARSDRPGDGRFDVEPRAAVVDLVRHRRAGLALGQPFDIGPLINPGYDTDGSALGISQDLTALPSGFGTVHTEPAEDGAGTTRVVYSRVTTRPRQ